MKEENIFVSRFKYLLIFRGSCLNPVNAKGIPGGWEPESQFSVLRNWASVWHRSYRWRTLQLSGYILYISDFQKRWLYLDNPMHPQIKHCIVFWEGLKAFKWFCAPTLQIGFVCVYVELCVCVRLCVIMYVVFSCLRYPQPCFSGGTDFLGWFQCPQLTASCNAAMNVSDLPLPGTFMCVDVFGKNKQGAPWRCEGIRTSFLRGGDLKYF